MRGRWIAWVLVVGSASWAWGSGETRVYRAQHRSVAELGPLAEAALGDEGHVAVDARTASLVMVGKPAALERALALLRSQDRLVETLIIDYWLERRATLEATSVRVDWAIDTGSFRIGRLGARGSGLRVALESSRSGGDSTLSGRLRLSSGGSGAIVTGDAFPFVAVGPYAASTEFVLAESGFEARASVLGSGDVALELRPFDGRLVAGGVRYTAAGTELILAPGEIVILGAVSRDAAEKRVDPLGGFATREASEEELLFVSVVVAPPARP